MAEEKKIARDEDDLLGEGPPLADWLEGLSHDSPFQRPQGAAAWGRDAPPLAAVRSLISILKDPDREVRIRAVTALGNLGGQARWALLALRAALEETALADDDESVHAGAVRALLQVGPQTATEIPGLIDSLRDDL